MSRRQDWPDIRAHILTEFQGEQPGAQLEAELIDLYETNPTAVLNAVPSIAKSLGEGSINSGWAVLRKAAATKAVEPAGKTVSHEKLVRNAEQWLKNTGCMYDRWTEVEDELFGDRGRLRTIDTPKLRDRYRETWDNIRPAGEQIEAEELERADHWKTSQANLARIKPTSADGIAALRRLATAKGAHTPTLQPLGKPAP